MSINRTRWLDKLRPAGASSGGWTEGPMAPVETTDAATVDQRCSFKHWTGWGHNHSNSKLCVAMRMGQANLFRITNCRLCAGAMLSSRSNFQQLDLCVSSLCKPYFRIVQKKNISDLDCHSCAGAMQQYPESHHLCTEAVQQCSAEDKASGSIRSSYLRTSIGGYHRFAPREHHGRSFWRETWR